MPPAPRSSPMRSIRQPTVRRIASAHRRAAASLLAGVLAAPLAVHAADSEGTPPDGRAQPAGSAGRPHTIFLQAGTASRTDMVVAGVTWDWPWQRDFAIGRLTGYWELSFGRWTTDHPANGSSWVTQFGVTPVLRLHPSSWGGRWFLEAGIGANVLLPVYRSGDKRFSSTFNFGDHLALGRRFGRKGEHELSVRLQHFSNAGIKRPNPGEDFVQLRYALRF